MKTFKASLAMLLFVSLSLLSHAQIKGRVTNAKDGAPIDGVTVNVKGGLAATSTNADGRFTINVTKNEVTLAFSAVGFLPKSLTAKNGQDITITLDQDTRSMNEVVVTALGVKRNKNSLPYAAQQVSGDEVSRARGGNIASALSGKVSGLQVIQGNGIGASTNVVIRGNKSLTSSNQALFVVDGVPIDNSNTNSANQRTGRGGYDYGNAAADINPDDIESVNVLKGAAATALYGSRAANGVIMITSKKAKRGLGITVNSGVIIGTMDRSTFPTYQKQYGAGYSDPYQKDGFLYFDANGDGVKDYVVPTAEDASYGVKFDPNLLVYHWDAFDPASPNYRKAKPWVAAQNDPRSFYETSVSTNNNVMFDGVSDKGFFKLGYTRNSEKGILPNSKVIKNIINFGASYAMTDKLTFSALINYSKIDGKGRYGTGYNGRNVNQNFRQWYQTNVDVQEQKEAYFRNRQNITWNWSDPSTAAGTRPIYTDNYYWIVYQNYETDTRSRVFGNIALDYKPLKWLSLLARITVDNYTELQEERIAVGSQLVPAYSRFDRTYNEINYDFMANVDHQLTADINFKALAGINMRRNQIRSSAAATNGGLVVAGLYSIANSKGTVTAPVEAYQPKAVDGYFGGVTFDFRKFLTVDATIRRDRSSTLPESANAYNYYALSGSWLFSHHLKELSWLSSGKLRVNYATVGNDAPWGSVKDVYDQPAPFGGSLLYSLPPNKNNDNLIPEETRSKEIGIEAAFLRNRLGFDITYYHTNTTNQIIPVAVSTSTGYSNKFVNAGNIENKGIELSLYATPVKTKYFSWVINVNWTRNRNKVLELYNDSKNLQLAALQGGVSINATLGQPYGTIQGKTWDLVNGERLVKANGRYSLSTSTSNVIGNVNPDWTGGVYNTLKYKNLSLGFLIDVRQGGDVFSLDMFYGMATGVLPESVGLNDLGNPSRNTIATGGGVIMPGVTADGKPNTKRVENVFGTFGYAQNPAAAFVYDASYVKLRELNLTYSIPQRVFGKVKAIKGAEVGIIGRNLWIIHKNLPYSDPEETLSSGNVQGYQSGAYPTTRSIGVNVKVKF